MVTVNEHLPEDHRDRITDFGDIRDEEHMPPGNSSENPRTPTQDELLAANEAMEASRGTVVGDASVTTGEEDLLIKPHQGASSWYSDPDAMSSDLTQRNQPGYEVVEEAEAEAEEEVETSDTEPEDEDYRTFDPLDHTIPQVEAHVATYPDDLARVLEAEQDSQSPRSSLITKLEGMGG